MQLKYVTSFWFIVLISLTPFCGCFNPSKEFGILNKTSAQHAYSQSFFTVLFLLNLRIGMVLCSFCMVVPLLDVTTWNYYSLWHVTFVRWWSSGLLPLYDKKCSRVSEECATSNFRVTKLILGGCSADLIVYIVNKIMRI